MKSYEKVLLFMPNTPLQHIVAMGKKTGTLRFSLKAPDLLFPLKGVRGSRFSLKAPDLLFPLKGVRGSKFSLKAPDFNNQLSTRFIHISTSRTSC